MISQTKTRIGKMYSIFAGKYYQFVAIFLSVVFRFAVVAGWDFLHARAALVCDVGGWAIMVYTIYTVMSVKNAASP